MKAKTLDVQQFVQESSKLPPEKAAMALSYLRGLMDAQSMAEEHPAEERKAGA